MRPPSSLAFRLALVYVGIFGWIGAYLPYWPVWLADRGMSPTQIGILLGMAPWTRLIANPIAGRWADRSGRASSLVLRLTIALVLSLTSFMWLDDFTGLLLGMIAVGMFFAPINPLTDGITVGAEAEGRLRYGPVRLWGSAAFIVSSWVGGELLEHHGTPVVLQMMIGLAGIMVLAALALPRTLPARSTTSPDRSPIGARPTDHDPPPPFSSRSRSFMGFLAVTGLLHASHAVLYALGTQHWRTNGLDEGTVGFLWAEAVFAEILLFACGARVDRWLSPRSLWLLAGGAGVIRWGLLASTVVLPWLALGQALHALTFGALHLGSMAFIRHNVSPHARGRASTSYSVATGLALGVALPLAGILYDQLSANAYWFMAGLSAMGLLVDIRGPWCTRALTRRSPQHRPVSSSRQLTSNASSTDSVTEPHAASPHTAKSSCAWILRAPLASGVNGTVNTKASSS